MWYEIVSGEGFCDFRVGSDDGPGLFEGVAEAVMAVMTLEPAVTMVAVT